MKKITILSLILCVAVLAAAVAIPAGKAAISGSNWLSPVVKSQYDNFYGATITGYAEDTSAKLVVNVINTLGGNQQLNVSAVIVAFDWAINYTSSECSLADPYPIPSGQPHVFTIEFTVPSTLIASNMMTHTYAIYVEGVNGTSANDTKVITTLWSSYPLINFVVFSTDQATATDQLKQLTSLKANTGIIPMISAHGRQLQQQSAVEEDLGDASYMKADFESAATHYTTALALLQQAWGNETSTWASGENSLIGMIQGGANMLNLQGCAVIIVSIGFLLMGVGVIVYLMRKSKQPLMK